MLCFRLMTSILCLSLSFGGSPLWAQGRGEATENLRRDLRQRDSDTGQQGVERRGAGDVELRSPSTEDFFRSGRRVFPSNFQSAQADFRPEALGDSDQVSRDYPVGPGDQFLINFWGKIEDNIVVSISSEDELFIPRIGVIDAEGLTYHELQGRIEEAINREMKEVQFAVSLYQHREFQVYVLGSVANPGPVQVRATSRASDVVGLVGGPSGMGSRQFIELRRGDEKLRVDLLRYMSFADFSKNPYVTDGDVIFVPDMSDFVTVRGAVVRPGSFEIRETRSLSEVIEQMGGLSVYADRQAPIRVSRLTEDGERVQRTVIFEEAHRESASDQLIDSFQLQNGDEVFISSSQLMIPSHSDQVFVTGQVRAPGAQPYRITTSVEEYLGSAGGLTSRAQFSNAVVYKADGSTVDLQPRTNIEPGDTIYIPEKTFKFWQDHLSILTTFLTLATTIITVTR